MNEFVKKLNSNCENRNQQHWIRWTEKRFPPNGQLYCVDDDAGIRLCRQCNEDIAEEMNSSFDTVLCNSCFEKFSYHIVHDSGYLKGNQLVEWLTSTLWICDECETNLSAELNRMRNKRLESRIVELENAMRKICQKMDISKE